MNYSRVIGIALIIVSGCVNKPETDGPYTLSFPLVAGTIWEYESITKYDGTTTDSIQVYTSITSVQAGPAGFPVVEFKDSIRGTISFDYFEHKPDGLYLYAATSGGYHALWKSATLQPGAELNKTPILYVPWSFNIGDTWTYDTVVQNDRKTALTRFFVGMENVATRAGSFDCYKFETTGYLNEKRHHYYCPDIGLVIVNDLNKVT